jgi:hypothetical protein
VIDEKLHYVGLPISSKVVEGSLAIGVLVEDVTSVVQQKLRNVVAGFLVFEDDSQEKRGLLASVFVSIGSVDDIVLGLVLV